jgi:hypothetical protein
MTEEIIAQGESRELIAGKVVKTKNRLTASRFDCQKDINKVLLGLRYTIEDPYETAYKSCFLDFLNATGSPKYSPEINKEVDKLEETLPGLRSILKSLTQYYSEKDPLEWGRYPYPDRRQSLEPGMPPYHRKVCISVAALKDYIRTIMPPEIFYNGFVLETTAGYALIPEKEREKSIDQWRRKFETEPAFQMYDGLKKSLEVKMIKNKRGNVFCVRA